jgi:ABC-type transporter Mla subunit MlaD
VASLADLEARVAALEADRADYRAVLAAVGATGSRVGGLESKTDALVVKTDDLVVRTDANRESINALGEKLAGFQTETRQRFETLEQKIDANHAEMTARFRSVDEHFAELRELIVDGFGDR